MMMFTCAMHGRANYQYQVIDKLSNKKKKKGKMAYYRQVYFHLET